MLSLAITGVLAGARSLTAIWEHTTDPTAASLEALGLPEGQVLPSESTIRRVLQDLDPADLDAHLGSKQCPKNTQQSKVYSQQREETGKPLQRMVEEQRKAHVDGVEQGRFYDELAQEADGTWTGIENKHGTASLKAEQREFDQAVSSENPARARLDTGEVIEVVRVAYTYE